MNLFLKIILCCALAFATHASLGAGDEEIDPRRAIEAVLTAAGFNENEILRGFQLMQPLNVLNVEIALQVLIPANRIGRFTRDQREQLQGHTERLLAQWHAEGAIQLVGGDNPPADVVPTADVVEEFRIEAFNLNPVCNASGLKHKADRQKNCDQLDGAVDEYRTVVQPLLLARLQPGWERLPEATVPTLIGLVARLVDLHYNTYETQVNEAQNGEVQPLLVTFAAHLRVLIFDLHTLGALNRDDALTALANRIGNDVEVLIGFLRDNNQNLANLTDDQIVAQVTPVQVLNALVRLYALETNPDDEFFAFLNNNVHGFFLYPAIPLEHADNELLEHTMRRLPLHWFSDTRADLDNQFPLHQAVRNGDLQAAILLLGGGVDVNAIDAQGMAPIHIAILNNHFDMVRLLIFYRANPNAFLNPPSSGGCFMPLIFVRSVEMAQLLIDSGANVNLLNPDGDSVLGLLLFYSAPSEIVKHVIQAGADVNYKNPHVLEFVRGEGLPLAMALRCYRQKSLNDIIDVVLCLLANGADFGLLSKDYRAKWVTIQRQARLNAAGQVATRAWNAGGREGASIGAVGVLAILLYWLDVASYLT